jgi:TnpA family transposase
MLPTKPKNKVALLDRGTRGIIFTYNGLHIHKRSISSRLMPYLAYGILQVYWHRRYLCS